MISRLTARLATDAVSVVVIMYKETDDGTLLARFVLQPNGEWKQVFRSEAIPDDIKIPVILEGE